MFRSSAKPLSGRYLSLVEREIALLRVQGYSRQAIGRHLGRAGLSGIPCAGGHNG
ncbi:helix-turn-helix domain-containing protein [Mesorhizobium jarvisii]|nr:helix-turn-helix domain-containing protein [Mesorhizobium jarvisii]MCH4561241.1 helix-turn-helix domain-containing protein [Mesorhizobium jarvisii]